MRTRDEAPRPVAACRWQLDLASIMAAISMRAATCRDAGAGARSGAGCAMGSAAAGAQQPHRASQVRFDLSPCSSLDPNNHYTTDARPQQPDCHERHHHRLLRGTGHEGRRRRAADRASAGARRQRPGLAAPVVRRRVEPRDAQRLRDCPARTGNRRFGPLSAPRAHTNRHTKTELLWETLRARNCPGRGLTVLGGPRSTVPPGHLLQDLRARRRCASQV